MKLTRREALFGAAATALCAATAPVLASVPWVARHGMNAGQFQTIFDDLVSQGYRLTHTDGYAVNGSPQFAAIWEQRAGPAWIAHDLMTSEHYQRKFDRLVSEGYRLIKVSGYEADGDARYAALWMRSAGPPFEARHGMTGDEYQTVFNQLCGQGYRQTWVSGYTVGGEPRFAAIFEKTSGTTWFARFGMNSGEYQAEFNKALSQGYRLHNISGYAVDDTPYFAAIWEKTEGPGWQARHNMTSSQYQEAFNTFTGQGMRLADVSGYGVGSEALYAAYWIGA